MERVLLITNNQTPRPHLIPPKSKPLKLHPKSPLTLLDRELQSTVVWTGRYEAHLWDNSCRRDRQTRKGRKGGYDKEEKAARAYDLAALKYRGTTTTTNFPMPTLSTPAWTGSRQPWPTSPQWILISMHFTFI
ncbi:hypothetical protein JHK86_016425 [Glycine max]|nr:hypothetical protein JHK86_016425 [Glycine max]